MWEAAIAYACAIANLASTDAGRDWLRNEERNRNAIDVEARFVDDRLAIAAPKQQGE